MKPILLALAVLVLAGSAAAQTTAQPKKNNRIMKLTGIKQPRPFLSDPEKLKLMLSPNLKKPAGVAFSRKTTFDKKTLLSCLHLSTNEMFLELMLPWVVDYSGAEFGAAPNSGPEISFVTVQGGAQPVIYLFEVNIAMATNNGIQPVAPVFTIYNDGNNETQTISAISLTHDYGFKLIFTTLVQDQSSVRISCSNLNNWFSWSFINAQMTRVNP